KPGIEAHRKRHRQRLGDAEGDEMAMRRRQGAREHVEDAIVDEECGHGPDRDRTDCDEDALPQLLHVLDERRVFPVREPAHAHRSDVSLEVASGRLAWVTESLNSRMPVPSERPISGTRLAPKSISTMTSRMPRCIGLSRPVIRVPPGLKCR